MRFDVVIFSKRLILGWFLFSGKKYMIVDIYIVYMLMFEEFYGDIGKCEVNEWLIV